MLWACTVRSDLPLGNLARHRGRDHEQRTSSSDDAQSRELLAKLLMVTTARAGDAPAHRAAMPKQEPEADGGS